MVGDEAEGLPTEGGATWRTVTLVVMALAGAATIVALVLILAGANRQRDRALELQAHSYDVMILARSLSGTIARSEASLGRYVISGDTQFGTLYFDEWSLAGSQINRLTQLTSDSDDQAQRVLDLRDAFRTRGTELSTTALSTRYGKNAQALARYYQAAKAPALEQISATLDGIIDRERALLDQRTGDAMLTVDRSNRIAGVLAVFGMLIVLGAIALGWVTVRAIADRTVARADANLAYERADELTQAVLRATDALRLQEAKLRQVQKMEAVGQLTGGIAHDFNNMLSVVLGGLELAGRSLPSIGADNARRHIDSATEGAARAAALTRRLLAFSREDAVKPEPVVVGTLVAGMSDLLDRTLGDAITLRTNDRSENWRVCVDRVQLENAVLNLAVNARDAMDGRGELTIATATTRLQHHQVNHCSAGEYVAISVTDTGSGMSPEIAERVFEPFFTTKPIGKGTGLGLSQIFALVRQLSGEVLIDTAPGRGTTVTLYLPRDSAVVETGTVVELAAPIDIEPRMLTILVVEDDPRVLAATMGALEELGHRGLACDDPLAAPAMLDRVGPVDLVISDVLMPRQTGPEMVAGLLDQRPGLAILFVTGFAGEAAGEFGDRQVLRKPFTLLALERAISDATVAPPAAQQVAAE